MLRWLDFKNIFIWLGFSHFFAMLSFFFFFFYYETDVFWKEHVHHMAWLLKFGLSHRDLPTEEKKKQTKKKSKGKSSHWLLGKNSKRHNFTGSKQNHVLQKVICLFKHKYNLWGGLLIHRYILNFSMVKCCFSCLLGKINWYQTPWFLHQITR